MYVYVYVYISKDRDQAFSCFIVHLEQYSYETYFSMFLFITIIQINEKSSSWPPTNVFAYKIEM